ncbi:MAG TPA: DUF188 domain-containing protein [Clostridiales bacterium]|nr:DUF188 domain-containing protein [Clostridiales bacterium]
MKIFIDADGCPVVDIAVKIAKEYKLEIIIVKNYNHEILNDYATIITVDQTPDSADYYIGNNAVEGDIVVTQDYGLAALALSKGALCLNQNGLIISSENIDSLLDQRYFNQEMRRKHKKYTKFKKRTIEQDKKFEISLIELIQKLIRDR